MAGPVAAGLLVDAVSYGAAFGLAAAVLILAAVLAVIAPETRWLAQDRSAAASRAGEEGKLIHEP